MTPPLDLLVPTTSHQAPATTRRLIIDNFAGAGGASEGIRLALGRDPDYAINHSAGALVMHRANHPGTVHLCEDVFHVDGQPVDEPAPTISAQGTHVAEVRAFLVKYYGTGGAKSVHAPIDTITAKERMGLVTIEGEDWQIVDIGMRMLTPRELARCQGFDDSYVFTDKTKSDQVARIGNSVPPPIAAAIVRANYSEAL